MLLSVIGLAGYVVGWWRGWRVGVDETIAEYKHVLINQEDEDYPI